MSETKESFTIHHGDCLDVLRSLPDCSVDSVVSDPPYGLSFMGKKWDYDVPAVEVWQECLRVLKPGGHLLAFAGTRTQHRMAVRIEDAGFEIRDIIAWVYGSGFPKSLDVSKAIDKAAGAEREVIGESARHVGKKTQRLEGLNGSSTFAETPGMGAMLTAPATEAAKQWQGWGTALKPALEPITVARKPLIGTVAENVLEHGTGAINVDGCRVPGALQNSGRWPANLIHDGSEEVTELLNDAARFFKCCPSDSVCPLCNLNATGDFTRQDTKAGEELKCEPSRFAYVPKASKKDRDEGLEGFQKQNNMRVNAPRESEEAKHSAKLANFHPTVKPTDLMRYLCRLVTCPGGVVLDPFTGSGSTGKAAVLEGFRFIGIEREAEYVQIARARIGAVQQEKPEPDLLLI